MIEPGENPHLAMVNWESLRALARKLSILNEGPRAIQKSELEIVEKSLHALENYKNWEGIIELRELFEVLVRGETTGGLQIVKHLNDVAIEAAFAQSELPLAARYLHDEGENYHRRGLNRQSILALERSADLYRQAKKYDAATKSLYFSALPYRALGQRRRAKQILSEVLAKTDKDDPWRANPLQVMSWMLRDEGRFPQAESTLRDALALYQQLEGDKSIHAVQTLADIGEIVALQGRYGDATSIFEHSLEMLKSFSGQFDRQEARTKLKYAETLNGQGLYDQALTLLEQADNIMTWGSGYYYEMLLRIELARVFAHFGKCEIISAMRRAKLVLLYKREIDFPARELARYVTRRLSFPKNRHIDVDH